MKYITTVDGTQYTIDINDDRHITVNGKTYEIDFTSLSRTGLASLILDGQSFDVDIAENTDTYAVMLKGVLHDVQVEDERTRRLAGMKRSMSEAVGEVLIKAPMPGVIVEIPVEVGQEVAKNQVVAVLESMKMQNEFKSPKNGVVKSVRVKAGDKIDQNTVMVSVA